MERGGCPKYMMGAWTLSNCAGERLGWVVIGAISNPRLPEGALCVFVGVWETHLKLPSVSKRLRELSGSPPTRQISPDFPFG